MDEAVAAAVQIAVGEERARASSLEVERDSYRDKWREAEASKASAIRRWQIASFLTTLLAAGAVGGVLLGR